MWPIRSGRGPVGFCGVNVYMDHTDQIIGRIRGIYYSWATKRNKLRCLLSLLTKFRASSRISLYVAHGNEQNFNMYNRLHEYALPVKHVGNGFFAMPGRKK